MLQRSVAFVLVLRCRAFYCFTLPCLELLPCCLPEHGMIAQQQQQLQQQQLLLLLLQLQQQQLQLMLLLLLLLLS